MRLMKVVRLLPFFDPSAFDQDKEATSLSRVPGFTGQDSDTQPQLLDVDARGLRSGT